MVNPVFFLLNPIASVLYTKLDLMCFNINIHRHCMAPMISLDAEFLQVVIVHPHTGSVQNLSELLVLRWLLMKLSVSKVLPLCTVHLDSIFMVMCKSRTLVLIRDLYMNITQVKNDHNQNHGAI